MTLEKIRKSSKYFNTKRISFDLLALVSVLLLAYFAPTSLVPIEAKMGFLSLLLSKAIFVSAGIIHAHIVRKLLFPYVDLNKTTDNIIKAFIGALYICIIWAYARGG